MRVLESRIARFIVAIQVCCLAAIPVFAIVRQAEGAESRSETVNVTMDADGAVESEKVTTIVKNADGTSQTVEDESSEQTPITVAVSYKLDGKDVSASELAGKSGDVVIRYDYENHSRSTQEINGKEQTVFTPFTVITALMIDDEIFSNVEVTNGKIIEDKGTSIVAGYAFPGLRESLGFESGDSDIPEFFELRAHAEGFQLKSTLTMATAGLFADIDSNKLSLGEAADAPAELSNAMGALIDGSDQLDAGLDQLAAGSHELKAGSEELNNGAVTLDYGIHQAAAGASELSGGAASMASGLNVILNGDGTASNPGLVGIRDGYAKLAEALHTMNAQMNAAQPAGPSATTGLEGAKATLGGIISEASDPAEKAKLEALAQQLEGVSAVIDAEQAYRTAAQSEQAKAVGSLSSTLDALNGGLNAEVNGLGQAAAGASSLSSGASELDRGLQELAGGSSQLVDATGSLAQGTGEFASGLEGAARGSHAITDGMRQFDEEGIGELENVLVNKYGATIDKANALTKAANEYKSFTGKGGDADSSVKFVFETKPISPAS